MSGLAAGLSPDWLALREPADAAARSAGLARRLAAVLPAHGPAVVHDLGCGTGSMGRWLAPYLPGPQEWVLYDRDRALLDRAVRRPPSAGGRPVPVRARRRDVTRLDPADLDGATVITASALLDMLTAEEAARLVATCAEVGCPVLVALSVVGRVRLDPPDPLDREVEAAFNDHQRRTVGGRGLLGPDAVAWVAAAFSGRGREVVVRPSPWHLGPDSTDLAREWFTGWLSAAVAQRPSLTAAAALPDGSYARRRLAQLGDGRLGVTVEHVDLLVLPASAGKPIR